MTALAKFERELERFLSGEIGFDRLDAVRRETLASAPESAAQIEHRVRELYAAGRLPRQLYDALGGDHGQNAMAAAESRDYQPTRVAPAATAGAGGNATPDDERTVHTQRGGEAARDERGGRPRRVPDANVDDRTVRTQRGHGADMVDRTVRTQRNPEAAIDDRTVRTQRDAAVTPDERTVRTQRDGPGGGAGPAVGKAVPGVTKPSDTPEGVPEVGAVIKGRFVLESVIGLGGMGVVFAARDLRKEEAQDTDPYVAMKILNTEFRQHPQALITLQRESRKAQALAHPNIINVFDFDRDEANVFMTMELLKGQTLLQLIRQNEVTGLGPERGVQIITDIAKGLAHAHRNGTVHSDLKPGNVFVTDDGRVKILDFDIARTIRYGGDGESADPIFDAGDLGGMTPGYASLEMLNGERAEMSDDVYALAVTAYHLLTGQRPFGQLTADEAYREGRHPRPIKGLKRREWKAIAHALAFKREDRTKDAMAFLREFRGATPITKSIAATIVVLAGLAGYFAVQSVQPEGPKVPFNDLPPDVRSRVTASLERADIFMTMQRYQQARSMYEDAYNLHEGNRDAIRGLDQILELKLEEMRGPASLADLQRYMADLEGFQTNAYFKQHKGLLQAKKDLEDRINERR